MIKIIAVLAFFVSVPAMAGDLYLDVNGYSWHSNETYVYQGKRHEYNSKNSGVGATYGINKYLEIFGGYYYNSFKRDTLYGGAKIKRDFDIAGLTFTPGINVGVATGYMDTPSKSDYYQIVIMPAVRVTYRGVGLTLGYVPRVVKENFAAVSVLTVQVNILFGRF